MWHSGDYNGLQSQRSRVHIQVSAKKKTVGLDQRLGLELGGSMGLGLAMGLDVWLGESIGLGIGMGLDVWLGGPIGLGKGMGLDVGIGMGLGLLVGVLFFLRNTPSPKKRGKLPSWKKLTS